MDDNAPTLRPRWAPSEAPPLSTDDVNARVRVANRRISDLEAELESRKRPSMRPTQGQVLGIAFAGIAAILTAGGGFQACSTVVRELKAPPECTRQDLEALRARDQVIIDYLKEREGPETGRWMFTESALCKMGYRDSGTDCDSVAWEQRAMPGNKVTPVEWRSREYWKRLPPPPR